MSVSNHERRNRAFWDADADDYQAAHAVELAPARAKAWGAWRIPEAELHKAKELSKGRLLLRMEDTRSVSSWLGAQELLTDRVIHRNS